LDCSGIRIAALLAGNLLAHASAACLEPRINADTHAVRETGEDLVGRCLAAGSAAAFHVTGRNQGTALRVSTAVMCDRPSESCFCGDGTRETNVARRTLGNEERRVPGVDSTTREVRGKGPLSTVAIGDGGNISVGEGWVTTLCAVKWNAVERVISAEADGSHGSGYVNAPNRQKNCGATRESKPRVAGARNEKGGCGGRRNYAILVKTSKAPVHGPFINSKDLLRSRKAEQPEKQKPPYHRTV